MAEASERKRTRRGEQLEAALGRLGYFNTTDLNQIGQSFFDAFDMIGITEQDLVDSEVCPEPPDYPTPPQPAWPPWDSSWTEKTYEAEASAESDDWDERVTEAEKEYDAEVEKRFQSREDDRPFNAREFASELDVAAELIKELADRGFKIVRA